MNRMRVLILAGFLTAVTMGLIILASDGIRGAQAALGSEQPEISTQAVDGEADAKLTIAQQADALYHRREEQLLAQVAGARSNVADLDRSAQAELAQLQTELAGVEQSLEAKINDIGALAGTHSILEDRLQKDRLQFEATLAQLQSRDTQLRQQLDATLAELEAAYAEIGAMQPVAPASSSDSGGQSGSSSNGHYEDDDDHDDHEHDDDDHDDHEHDDDDHDDHEHDDDD